MAETATAVTAMPANDMTFSCYAFAHLHVSYAGPHFYNRTYELMTHRIRRGAMLLCPEVPFIHMEVRTADSGFLHFDKDVINAHFRHRYIFHPDAIFSFTLYQSFHIPDFK